MRKSTSGVDKKVDTSIRIKINFIVMKNYLIIFTVLLCSMAYSQTTLRLA